MTTLAFMLAMLGQQADLRWGQNWQSDRPAVQAGETNQPSREVVDAYARQSVRIIKQEPHRYGFGSGTVVRTTAQHSYVLTCGHLVRNGGKGLYVQRIGEARARPAKLVSVSTKADLAALEIDRLDATKTVNLSSSQPRRIVIYAIDGDRGQFHRHAANYIGTGAIDGSNPLCEVALYRIALHAGDSGGGCWDLEGNFAGVGSHVASDQSESATATTKNVREFLETCQWWHSQGFGYGGYSGYGGYGGYPSYGGYGGYGGGYGFSGYQPQRLQTYGFIDLQPQFRSQPVFQGWIGRGEIFVGPQYQTYGGYGMPYGNSYGGYVGGYGGGLGVPFGGGGCPGGFCGYPQ